jgi:ATP-dependent DNA helicase RecQ
LPSPIQILQQYWGYNSFRPGQLEVINTLINGQDVLALMPTSAGKSICFQIPAILSTGTALVISPLIALMKNQVENLKAKGISAEAIYSGMHHKEIDRLLDNAVYGSTKFLYVSPERLQSKMFLERLKRMTICLVVVDEAHCISEWGYDFRPPYLEIAKIRTYVPNVNTIALTASANNKVVADIAQKLVLKQPVIFKNSFARNNINYMVRHTPDKDGQLLKILRAVPGSAIIYVRSRRKAQNTATWLKSHHIPANYYHAGLDLPTRNQNQTDWLASSQQVMVATNAFGMGIDKPNVRLVIHTDLPESLENYYQEAGRAGRDERKAFAVLLYNNTDVLAAQKQLGEAYPTPDYLKTIYQALANYLQIPVGSAAGEAYPFDIGDFSSKFDFKIKEVNTAIDILCKNGLFTLSDTSYQPAKVQIIYSKEQLYSQRIQNSIVNDYFQLLLRLYGGALFTDFIEISEAQIAKYLNVSSQQVCKQLKLFAQNGFINYLPVSKLPSLTYLSARVHIQNLQIDTQKLAFLQKREKTKLESMVAYAENSKQCRQKIILEYFDEENPIACGHCDVCLAKNKKSKNIEMERNALVQNILQFLAQKPQNIKQICDKLTDTDPLSIAEAMQLLLENKQINQNKFGVFSVL